MKILVRSRHAMCSMYEVSKRKGDEEEFLSTSAFISIYSSDSTSPFPDRTNILKLRFDDIICEIPGMNYVLFTKYRARMIKLFADGIQHDRLFIHCDAGISRSGAVGFLLDEYFNKYKSNNEEDHEFFLSNNQQILPNPLVIRILKPVLFGETDYSVMFLDKLITDEGLCKELVRRM